MDTSAGGPSHSHKRWRPNIKNKSTASKRSCLNGSLGLSCSVPAHACVRVCVRVRPTRRTEPISQVCLLWLALV